MIVFNEGKIVKNKIKQKIPMFRLYATLLLTAITVTCYANTAHAQQPGIDSLNSSPFKINRQGGDSSVGAYQEETVDLRVKSVGGFVEHVRYLHRGILQFNPKWSNLKISFSENKVSEFPTKIERNDREYFRQGDSSVYVYKGINYITKTETGYQWHDRKGTTIFYDEIGFSTGYEDRNNIKVYFKRNTKGQLQQIENSSGSVLLDYEYDADGFLIKVKDQTGREINYFYEQDWPEIPSSIGVNSSGYVEGKFLTRVTDVMGKDWTYKYSDGYMVERQGPNNQILSLFYGILPKTTNLVTPYKTSEKEIVSLGSVSSDSPKVKICSNWDSERWSRNSDNSWNYKRYGCIYEISKKYTIPPARYILQKRSTKGRILRGIAINNRLVSDYRYFYNKPRNTWVKGTVDGDGSLTVTDMNKDGDITKVIKNGRVVQETVIKGNLYTTIDENGLQTKVKKDVYKNITEVVHPDTSKLAVAYNTDYTLPIQIIDENGVETAFEYDEKGNLITLTEANGTAEQIVTTYTYDQYGQRTAAQYQDGTTETWAYDQNGNVTSYTDANNVTTQYQDFDALGNAKTIIDGRGKTWRYQYNAAGGLTQITTPLGHITQFSYDGRGNLNKIIDAKGSITQLEYDARNRPIKLINPHTASTPETQLEITQFDYNSKGQITQVIDPEGRSFIQEYDLDGNLVKTIDGNGNQTSSDFGYGSLKPYKGLLNTQTYPTGASSTLEYDLRNRLKLKVDETAGSTRSSRYQWDNLGNLLKQTDALNNTQTWQYDSHSRLTSHTDAKAQTTQYQYDSNHNLTTVINARNHSIRRFQYNDRGQLIKEILPDDTAYQSRYDANGNLTHQIDAKGQTQVHHYDDDNRLIKSCHYDSLGSADSDTSCTSSQKQIAYSYDELNRLTGYNDGTYSASYSYDANGRLLTFNQNYGSFSQSEAYSYYKNGLKKTFTRPDGKVISFSYDNNNQLQTYSIQDKGSITISERVWTAPKQKVYPGGATQNHQYDGYLRQTGTQTQNAASTVLGQFDYQYSAVDNLTQLQRAFAPSQNQATQTSQYSYDSTQQLTTYQTAQDTNIQTVDFEYDATGNRTLDSRTAELWQYDVMDRITQRDDPQLGQLNYQYDANGSLIQITQADNTVIRTFEYDLDKRLIKVTNGQSQSITTYNYDPFGKRLSKTHNGQITYYFYAQEGLVAELNASGQMQIQYGYEPDTTWGTNPVYIQQGTGTNSQLGFYQNDHLGTPQQIINTSGQILWQASYTPFGEAELQIELITNNLRLAGQYFDAETNLHYNYHRYYDPQLGRYISQDPIGLAGGINGYVYVYNNPLGLIDPLGLDSLNVNLALGAGGGVSLALSVDLDSGDVYFDTGIGFVGGISLTGTYSFETTKEGHSWNFGANGGLPGPIPLVGSYTESWDADLYAKTGKHDSEPVIAVGAGFGAGASVSATFNKTWKIGNIKDEIESFKDFLENFNPENIKKRPNKPILFPNNC